MFRFCSLYSGSSGNSLFVRTEKTRILIDAGLSGKKIIDALCSIGETPAEINGLLISHEHSDHIRGAGILSRKLGIPIYATQKTWDTMFEWLKPVAEENIKIINTEKSFMIGDIEVKAFSTPHDAVDPVGFSFTAFGRKITIATDIGHINDSIIENIHGSHLVLLESNHDVEMLKIGGYPWYLKQRILGKNGHLSNDAAGEFISSLVDNGTKKILLGHLSRENNFPELAYETVKNILCKNKLFDQELFLEVAMRDRVGKVIVV
jgi:phosphoribosyl 1,2-cyclic phosphodiesterase